MSIGLLPSKVCVITGSSRGIGRACALECARQGGNLVLHYHDVPECKREVDELGGEIAALGRKFVSVAGDISDPRTSEMIVESAKTTFGRVDVLVSNAGICPFHTFWDMPLEVYHRTRSVNMDGTFYIVQAVANVMKTQIPQGGSIVGISSISALVGGAEQCHYTPTKAAILSLMQSCAVALGPYHIRCNAVLPGTIATDINKEDLSNVEKRAYMEKRTPLGRLGVPEDIAGPVVFLASDMARYVTGAQVLVDGGCFVNLQ